MNELKDFLEKEFTSQEYYDEIMWFILSINLRIGELKGNKYYIKKMDRNNFIIYYKNILEEYSEESYIDLDKEVVVVKSICKDDFCKVINDYIVRQGMKKFDINEG